MMRNLLNGAISGAVATGAMSAVMVMGRRMGMMGDQPPKRIARAVLPGHRHRPKPGEGLLGAVAHLGFGSAAGALFGLATRGRRAPAPLGVTYGLVIWVGSYAGWVPRLDILPPISRDRTGRQVVLAIAHAVYGATLARTMNRLTAKDHHQA